jgi:antitoxin component YwqK of YwqJK toxin-antitoxin module
VRELPSMKQILFLFVFFATWASLATAQTMQTEFWPSGHPKSAGAYQNDVLPVPNPSKSDAQKGVQAVSIGKWQHWYENGQLQSEQSFSATGQKIGIHKTWYANGKAESQLDLNAKTSCFWYDNGQKQSEGPVTGDGTQTGTWTGWHSNGRLNFEGQYDASGHKTGTWKFWDDKGQLSGQQNYKDGKLVN